MSEKRRRQGGSNNEMRWKPGEPGEQEIPNCTRWYAKFWEFIFDSRLRVLMITSWREGQLAKWSFAKSLDGSWPDFSIGTRLETYLIMRFRFHLFPGIGVRNKYFVKEMGSDETCMGTVAYQGGWKEYLRRESLSLRRQRLRACFFLTLELLLASCNAYEYSKCNYITKVL